MNKNATYRFRNGVDCVKAVLVRRYIVGDYHYERSITKPVGGSVTLRGNDIVDYQTGEVTGGDGGSWIGEFEVSTQFGEDE